MQLYQHQIDSISLIKDKDSFLLAHDMGTGKSLTALSSSLSFDKVLIVCPSFLIFNWINEINKFYPEHAAKFKVKSYSSLYKDNSLDYKVIIADECQYLKNLDAQRTQIFIDKLEKINPIKLILLSGTPIKNRVTEFYTLIGMLYRNNNIFKKRFSNYYSFCNHFANKREFFIGNRKIIKYEGHRNIDDLRALLKPVYHRVKLNEVVDLPEKVVIPINIKTESNDKELLEEFTKFESMRVNCFTTYKRESALYKVPLTVDFVKNIPHSPILIFTDHLESANNLASLLNCSVITGDTPIQDRSEIFFNFQKGKLPYLVGTIGTCSTGVNLTAAHIVVFNDFSWCPSDLQQAEARVYRIGQKEKCLIYYMLGSKADAYIYKTIKKKSDLISKIV